MLFFNKKSAIYYMRCVDSLWLLLYNYIYEDIYYIKSKKEKGKRVQREKNKSKWRLEKKIGKARLQYD